MALEDVKAGDEHLVQPLKNISSNTLRQPQPSNQPQHDRNQRRGNEHGA
jgi:hypothetical protein